MKGRIVASSEEFLEYCLSQMENIERVKHKKMKGEYLIYINDVLVGGIYDDRLLVKQTEAGRKLMPAAQTALPYEGAKNEMLVVDCLDDSDELCDVLRETAIALTA